MEGYADDDAAAGGLTEDQGLTEPGIELEEGGVRASLPRKVPQVDTPLRVEPPSSVNVPARMDEKTREQQIKATAFSPGAFTMRKYDLVQLSGGTTEESASGTVEQVPPQNAVSLVRSLRQKQEPAVKTHSENQAPYRTAIRDYTMLAFASQRAGRYQMEGLAYYCMGVLLDNMAQYAKALESYKKFLAVSRRTSDRQAEALCFNCMGVDCMHMAVPPGTNPQESLEGITPAAASVLERAVGYHQEHLTLADEEGMCVAHTNLGLCRGLLGDFAQAAKHHQEALRVALRTQNVRTQCLAVGNLGLLAIRQRDYTTARACLEQHLQLAQSLSDPEGESHAWARLGELAGADGDPEHALHCLEQAANLAKAAGEVSTLKRLHCDMGVIAGNVSMEEHFREVEAFARTGYRP